MNKPKHKHAVQVGEIRPSQLMYSYGVGAVVDLPKLSVIVTGLDDWPSAGQVMETIVEDRLLTAVRYKLPWVKALKAPPLLEDTGIPADPFESAPPPGVPVATFPRWMVCPQCRLLAPLKVGYFTLKEFPFAPDRNVYRHENCNKGNRPEVVPARFLVACEAGHLDDFPWVEFVHYGKPVCDSPSLRLYEFGPSGEARDLEVHCTTCDARRRMAEAFGQDNRAKLPPCSRRRPQLRDYDPKVCKNQVRPLTLGQSNTWFPVALKTLSMPVESGKLAQLVDQAWPQLQGVTSILILPAFRQVPNLLPVEFEDYPDDAVMAAIEARRKADAGEGDAPEQLPDLKVPEWTVFTQYNPDLNNDDFRLRPSAAPTKYNALIEQVMLVERLREVSALIGFTRIDSAGELGDPDSGIQVNPAPLSRTKIPWVPAHEIRGEGIFIQFRESAIDAWSHRAAVDLRNHDFFTGHKQWRKVRRIEPAEDGYPGIRYVLLHSFAHALMRQFALDCGYGAASLCERIYSRPPESTSGAMAGVLIYTSAPDSEGTLGGLVSLGEPDSLEQYIARAFESLQVCGGDPVCAEHSPGQGQTLHGAACHACLFAPETSCERGNRYLDRTVLVPTLEDDSLVFF